MAKHLKITIWEARNLAVADSNGFSDPYAVIKVGDFKAKTKVIKKNLNPAWGEVFYIPTDADKDQSKLLIEVWDDDTLNDDFLGQIVVDLCGSYKPHGWYTLQPRSQSDKVSGEIRISIEFADPRKDS